jgi:hypothetical protein
MLSTSTGSRKKAKKRPNEQRKPGINAADPSYTQTAIDEETSGSSKEDSASPWSDYQWSSESSCWYSYRVNYRGYFEYDYGTLLLPLAFYSLTIDSDGKRELIGPSEFCQWPHSESGIQWIPKGKLSAAVLVRSVSHSGGTRVMLYEFRGHLGFLLFHSWGSWLSQVSLAFLLAIFVGPHRSNAELGPSC